MENYDQNSKIGLVDKIQCRNPITENYFNLTMQHIKLFQLIAYQGFMTLQQMDKYFALINKDDNKHISKHTLSRWAAARKGILSKATKSHHNMYSLNPWMVDWLIDNQFISDNDISRRQRNIHNLLLVESVTNGIYQAWKTCMESDYYQRVQNKLENGFALLAFARNVKNKKALSGLIKDSKDHVTDIKQLQQDNGLPKWLYGLDIRTYNRQLNITEEQAINLTLKPDALLRFKRTTIYVELDNRNESNFTLVEKIMNYISHARTHSKIDMNLLFIFNDGSLKNDRITQYKVPTSKLSAILQSTVAQQMSFGNKTLQVFKAYQQTPNLHIYLAPLKESYIDFSDILLNEDLRAKCLRSLKYWTNNMHPRFHALYKLNDNNNRYANNTAEGQLLLNNSTRKSPKVQFIFGQEHLMDTAISTLIAFNKAKSIHMAPFIILPVRNQEITLAMFKRLIRRNLRNLKQFSFNTIALLQQTPDYDYEHPTIKVFSHALANEQSSIPLNDKLIK